MFVNKSLPQTMPRTSIHTWPSIVSWPSVVMTIAIDTAVDTSLVKHSLVYVLLPARAGPGSCAMTYNTCPPTTL